MQITVLPFDLPIFSFVSSENFLPFMARDCFRLASSLILNPILDFLILSLVSADLFLPILEFLIFSMVSGECFIPLLPDSPPML